MVTLRHTMDFDSREIVDGDGEHVGYVQWHPDRPPGIILTEDHTRLSANEMWTCLQELQKQGKFTPPSPL